MLHISTHNRGGPLGSQGKVAILSGGETTVTLRGAGVTATDR